MMSATDEYNRKYYVEELKEDCANYSKAMVEAERRANKLEKEAESLRNQVAALHDAMRSEWKDLLARAERAEANAANWEEQANDRVIDWDEVRAERDALKLRLAAVEDMNAACNADFSRIRAERDALRAALSEAIVMVKHWGGYAPNYYQQKWDLEGDLDKLRAAIAKATQS